MRYATDPASVPPIATVCQLYVCVVHRCNNINYILLLLSLYYYMVTSMVLCILFMPIRCIYTYNWVYKGIKLYKEKFTIFLMWFMDVITCELGSNLIVFVSIWYLYGWHTIFCWCTLLLAHVHLDYVTNNVLQTFAPFSGYRWISAQHMSLWVMVNAMKHLWRYQWTHLHMH